MNEQTIKEWKSLGESEGKRGEKTKKHYYSQEQKQYNNNNQQGRKIDYVVGYYE